ncbi:MAG TPA: S8/S53 family peptidase [Streptosporangiaceae bacterium]|nr:S8/S53 family peptidase [Streptosporangiaceae bacterium]
MTTDGTPDYPDLRDEDQRRTDESAGAAQSAALTDSGPDPHQQVDELIGQTIELRDQAAALLREPPVLVDVLRPGGSPGDGRPGEPPDHSDPVLVILVVRGELLLRVPSSAPLEFDREAAARGDGEVPAWQLADIALRRQGFAPPAVHEIPPGTLPLLVYTSDTHSAEDLVQVRDDVRAESGADVDLNYMVPCGHPVKAEDYPEPTGAHRCYSPEWIRRHPVRRPIKVAVIDTGVNHLSRTDGWLTAVAEDGSNLDLLDVYPVTREPDGEIQIGDGLLDPSAGHGTFVSGVIEQVDPLADIRVYRTMDTLGWGTSYDMANALVRAAADGAEIINLSAGTVTVDGLAPLPFVLALEALQASHPHVLVVASAGNMGLDTPLFPAAMKGVVAVGALAADLTPAPWSSYGFWVDCSAVGVGVTSTFVKGEEPPHEINGQVVNAQFGPDAWAIWSGTSFSAPQIVGAVAMLCQLNDVDPATALGQLLADRTSLPGYGYVVPILPGS